jgi:hypothetical protein
LEFRREGLHEKPEGDIYNFGKAYPNEVILSANFNFFILNSEVKK